MAEKKRGGSFRRIFPNLFFSSKNKVKDAVTNRAHDSKYLNESCTSKDTKYQNPHGLVERNENCNQRNDENSEGIYENLSVVSNNEPISDYSLGNKVLENSKYKYHTYNQDKLIASDESNAIYKARPQVPPKPHTEVLYSSPNSRRNQLNIERSDYPDVYYHSLEKLGHEINPIDEIEIYRASQVDRNPASVGAEIKKVSTKFLISPTKEAEVRTIQPTRARSLSLDKNQPQQIENVAMVNNNVIEKPYNYSAPTSPISAYHKTPTMPLTVSPYEHVRKTMIETEEKRNSISRSSSRNKSTPSPRVKTPTLQRDINKLDGSIKKETTRQQVEAFYWHEIKKLKQHEDELLLRQAKMNIARSKVSQTNSARSTPNSILMHSRANSLPRGDLCSNISSQIYAPSPFVRGNPERRTDTFISSRSSYADSDIVYRYPEKLYSQISHYTKPKMPNHQYVSEVSKHANQSPAHATYEHGILSKNEMALKFHDTYKTASNEIKGVKITPRPPVRTTSVPLGRSYKIVNNKKIFFSNSLCSESESGSEAGEIQRIMQNYPRKEDDWQGDPRIDGGLSDGEASRGPPRGRASRRDDPRRHTLAGNHLYIHQHHAGRISTIDVEHTVTRPPMNHPEYATVTKCREMKRNQMVEPHLRKPPLPRYPQPTNALLFDDDPGVMSEVETASTGFRRGGKQRSSLPVVRTPSKTLERPLGLVFLQYRNETKRALLPNEITSIDTVKALFVRSFPKQLTMQYMDSPLVKIYIHDSSKDMFYELEDVRAHLRDIRDRSVLRLFESRDMGGGVFPGEVGASTIIVPPAPPAGPSSWDQDQSYFSEPEIDSDYHHQHVHKTKVKPPAYYMGTSAPSTLPRGGSLLRAFSPAAPPVPADRKTPGGPTAPSKPVRSYIPGSGSERCFPFAAPECPRGTDQLYNFPVLSSDGYMSSPERAPRAPYEDPYYTQYMGPPAGRANITPVIDEESNDSVIIDETYQMYGVNAITTAPRPMPRPPYDARLGPQVDDMQRLRVEKMERQLANLTGLVQKALQVPGTSSPTVVPRQDYQTYTAVIRPAAQDAARLSSIERPPKLGRDRFQKSVSFEKSVSFSDDPPDMNSPKQHSPQHSADTKPTKPAIKSSTLPRTSSQERDRLKPAPPPKPAGLVGQQMTLTTQKSFSINVNPDFFNQLQVLQNQSRDLRIETRNLRRSTLSHAIQMRQMMAETIVKIGDLAASFCIPSPESQLTREEEIYRQDMLLLENDLYELEATVERLRGQAANRETRVNMADIERIAMVLSKSSKTVADWKLKFPILQDTMKAKLAADMEKVVRKEKMLEEEPERLELALRRCKKLTGTLVTLKRLACVQEQRLPINDGRDSPTSSQSSTITAGPSSEDYNSENACHANQNNKGAVVGRVAAARGAPELRPENALDALLDELQTFSKPSERGRGDGPLRRLHSYPSGSDTDVSPPVRARGQHPPKPPVPERHPELLAMAARRAPPPPPPRTTSRSPLASPTSPSSPPSNTTDPNDEKSALRQVLLEQRHQDLLKKQRALQEQYTRLQMIQRGGTSLPVNAQPDLKKTGSESNLLTKMNLNLATTTISGSMTNLAGECDKSTIELSKVGQLPPSDTVSTTNKVYETDIL